MALVRELSAGMNMFYISPISVSISGANMFLVVGGFLVGFVFLGGWCVIQ